MLSMPDESDQFEQPTVTFEPLDEGGFQMKMSGWEQVIEEGYNSFEQIKKTFQTSDDVVPDLIEEVDEEGVEDSTDETHIRAKNPPKRLLNNQDWQILVLGSLYNYLAEVGLQHLAEDEYEAEQRLAGNGEYKKLLVRQSAFFEEYLLVECQLSFQNMAGRVLSNQEMKMIAEMGHQDRTRLAYLLGAVDEEQHGYLQQMVSARNDIAHNSWTDFDDEEEGHFEIVAKKVLNILEEFVEPDDAEQAVPQIDLSVLEE